MSIPYRRHLTISIVSYSELISNWQLRFKVAVAIGDPKLCLAIRSKIIIVDNRDTNYLSMDQFENIRSRLKIFLASFPPSRTR